MNADPDWRMRRSATRIDELDEQIVALLNERAACALEIGEAEGSDCGLRESTSPDRERARARPHVRRVNPGAARPTMRSRGLFERIIDEARRLERRRSASGNSAQPRARESTDGAFPDAPGWIESEH